ncbi:MAG: carbonic anhydrase [Candidatus Marinimicrobia bacterium]|jgi:carbonic anhydrase|nr:carbonic anhydrase [Candidatus Neomarinimicrobiota bacterium]
MNKFQNWQNVLDRLKSGNTNFVNDTLNNKLQDSIRRKEIVDGQNPFAVVLTCSDSRIVPELIFDTGIGEIFVIRVAGNVANPSSIASIEYAVAHLDIKLIIVLGHQNCGAVTAALARGNSGRSINHLLNFIHPAISLSDSKKVDDVSHIHAKLTAEQLIAQSYIIAKAIDNNALNIIPAYYNLESGQVDFFE